LLQDTVLQLSTPSLLLLVEGDEDTPLLLPIPKGTLGRYILYFYRIKETSSLQTSYFTFTKVKEDTDFYTHPPPY
jgi:hypothetical protein